jgi:hypothetical protein
MTPLARARQHRDAAAFVDGTLDGMLACAPCSPRTAAEATPGDRRASTVTSPTPALTLKSGESSERRRTSRMPPVARLWHFKLFLVATPRQIQRRHYNVKS